MNMKSTKYGALHGIKAEMLMGNEDLRNPRNHLPDKHYIHAFGVIDVVQDQGIEHVDLNVSTQSIALSKHALDRLERRPDGSLFAPFEGDETIIYQEVHRI